MAARMCSRLTLFLLFLSVLAWGQASSGTIVGSVHDPSGAAVPGAQVAVTNTATNVTRTTQSDASGEYQMPALIPGTYSVKASATGFTPQQANNVVINVQSRQLVNFALKIGSVSQQVEVVATPPVLETQSPNIGGVVTASQIVDLPLNGRRYSDLALLEPGVTTFPPGEEGHQTPDRFNVNGNLDLENDFLLDGTDNNSGSENLQEGSVQVVHPPPDALTEFRMQTRTYSAEFGTSAGAVINASVKSGTNRFHGDLWEFVRNNALDANTFFNNRNGVPIGGFQQNQFGGTLGGPILHNRTFFFADFQGLVSHQASTTLSTVPTPLMKQGNFSELSAGQLPLNPVIPAQAGCISNNVVQTSCIDGVAQKLFNLYPDPNVPSAVAVEGTPNSFKTNNYQSVYSIPNHTYSTDGRIDQTINNSNQVFGRYSFEHQNYVQTPPWTSDPIVGNGNFSALNYIRTQSFAFGWTDALTASTVNQFHFGFNRVNANTNPVGVALGTSVASQYGLNGIPPGPFTYGLPPLSVSGFSTLGGSRFRPQWQVSQVWQYSDSLSSIHGNHSLQFGYEYHRGTNTFLDIQSPQGNISATGIYTGSSNGGADYLLGDIGSVGLTSSYVAHNYYPGHAIYGQDTWRATSNLTLTYGLRYELFWPMMSRHNELANFYPSNNGEVLPVKRDATGAFARSTIHPDYKNFAPRLGFSYHPLQAMVVRGGYGIFYQHRDRIGSESMLDLNPPYLLDSTFSQQRGSTTPEFYLKDGFPGSLFGGGVNLTAQQIRAQDPNQRTPYVEQASLGLEFQVTSNAVLDVTGVGNWGRKMNRLRNANQGQLVGYDAANGNAPIIKFPYANLNTITQSDFGAGQHNYLELATNDGNTNYAGLEAAFRRQFHSGLSYGLDYTWSHSTSDFVDNLTGGSTPQNAYNYGAERSNSPFNVGRRFVGNLVWDLPIGRNRRFLSSLNRAVDLVAGGWEVNSIVTLQSGLPFTVSTSGSQDKSYSGPAHASRPNCVGDPMAGATTDPSALVNGTGFYMNPNAFAVPTVAGTFGNCAPRSLTGPGTENVDFSLFKSFPMGEARRFEIRGEFFNALNHPNFGFPTSTIGSGSFGHITSTTTPPREVQLAAKYYF